MGKILVAITVGVVSAFIGYCMHFDRQRRLDPDYKKKVQQRRMEMRRKMKNPPVFRTIRADGHSYDELERYFTQEIQLGQHLVASGAFEEGVVHLVNAILICQNPVELLSMLRQQMPPGVHRMLIDRLNETKEEVERSTEMPFSWFFENASSTQ